MRKRILSMGEALVDVLPAGEGLWRPVPGGSSYNVALALGRLGAPAAFVGRLSRDEQGKRGSGLLHGFSWRSAPVWCVRRRRYAGLSATARECSSRVG